MDTRVNIGRTVARERRRRGVTQEELAAHLGVSKAAVSKWELGQSLPDGFARSRSASTLRTLPMALPPPCSDHLRSAASRSLSSTKPSPSLHHAVLPSRITASAEESS